jgi:hypothetical protein
MKAKPVPAVASSESGAGRSGGKANVHVRRKSRTTRLPTPDSRSERSEATSRLPVFRGKNRVLGGRFVNDSCQSIRRGREIIPRSLW